jgi:DNA modification methylase
MEQLAFDLGVAEAVHRLATRPLRNEYQLMRELSGGTFTLAQLYRIAELTGLADRPGGRERMNNGQLRYTRRIRAALYAAHRAGRAPRNGAAWLIEGSQQHPTRALFVWLPDDASQLELVLGEAWDVLAQCDEPLDLILADPPWALNRNDTSNAAYQRTYGRDHTQVVDGYCEVDAAEYEDFTHRWIIAAQQAIRPGGYLAVVTGAQQAARVQVTAEAAGLTYVNSIAVPRKFGLRTTRRFVHQHWRITLMTNGPLRSKRRTFHVLPEFPLGANGGTYPVDVWPPQLEERRPGLLRYDNMLPIAIPSMVIRSTTNAGDLVGDPFTGGGTTPAACLTTGRRFYGGDKNPGSLRFTMGRILAEIAPALAAARTATNR